MSIILQECFQEKMTEGNKRKEHNSGTLKKKGNKKEKAKKVDVDKMK